MNKQIDLFSEPMTTAGGWVIPNDGKEIHLNSDTPTLSVNIKRLDEKAVIPQYAKDGDAAIDLVAVSRTINESVSRTTVVYGIGLSVEIPQGYVGLIFPRSSVYKTSLRLSNSVGVIDSGYRGEIMANFTVIHNPLQPGTWKNSLYEVGDRVAQLMILPYPKITLNEVEELTETERGEGGFGSTGN